jgi:dethiobiotin synthetase
MSAFFVTATGTGIGKTFVAAGLLRYLRQSGKPVFGLKPVVSGYEGAAGSDPAHLLEALSPDMAAAREQREIDFAELTSFCRGYAAQEGTLLIEGVGGVMVPLDARHTVLDWMTALEVPVVLVAGSYLGSLSHTLTAAAALERAGIKAIAVIVNDTGTGEVPLTDTAATLGRFLPRHQIAILPRNPASLDFAPLATAIFRESGEAAAR